MGLSDGRSLGIISQGPPKRRLHYALWLSKFFAVSYQRESTAEGLECSLEFRASTGPRTLWRHAMAVELVDEALSSLYTRVENDIEDRPYD